MGAIEADKNALFTQSIDPMANTKTVLVRLSIWTVQRY
jgi:hypothetical protein